MSLLTGADGRAPVSGGNPRILDDNKAQRLPSSGFIFSPGQPVMAQHQHISAVLTPRSAVPVMLLLPAVKLLRFR
jgi:hypothetical protein